MRHGQTVAKLGKTAAHRKALLRNMVISLIHHGRVRTTKEKAKAARSLAERVVTLSKRGTLHARRRALSLLADKEAVQHLFGELAGRFEGRQGGYTRIVPLAERRLGDGASQVLFEFVEPSSEGGRSGKKGKKKSARRKPKKTQPKEDAKESSPDE